MRLLISPKRHKEAERQAARTSEADLTRLEADSPYSEIEMASLKDMSADPILDGLSEDDKREVIKDTFELYEVAKEIVGPVVIGFADELLRESAGKKIMFAARDGIGALMAAQKLLERFPEEYPGVTKEDLLYPYLSRKVVRGTEPSELTEYLRQCGVEDPNSPVIMADTGMYGTVVGTLKRIVPKIETRYLISRNPSIPGYADDVSGQMSSLRDTYGNPPSLAFIEDTFSGRMSSASKLIRAEDGTLNPDIEQDPYPPAELMLRKYALSAIEDKVSELSEAPNQDHKERWVEELDRFLINPDNYAGMMVPHERG